ncbi:MAG: bifunctional hydroxymethylpyrimidine kinase/phosphomethylpyrimidine kinase [Eggerthellaceae bacterium]|nr:bifunctional hydroxymethylpyrimidine kinase/phosphomethylpyrimidine kinase [Eggerthellaceae bacterium]
MRSVLTIAGSDSSGGAGIQADIKTIAAHRLFAQSAITALTAQNTTGVYGVVDVPADFVAQQIDVVFDDIRPDAVKIGMVSSSEIIEAIASALTKNGATSIVVDPVMVATSGSSLIADDALAALRGRLLPLATVITPNIPEAEKLCGFSISSESDMEEASDRIFESIEAIDSSCTAAVLVKGGHGVGDPEGSDDLLRLPGGEKVWLRGRRLENPNTHGTGCSLSSAIACGLARGLSVEQAVKEAKEYVAGAIAANLDLGRGRGPLDHMWAFSQGGTIGE